MIKTVATDKAPGAIGPYSQAKIVGGFVFTSGQLGMFPNGMLPSSIQAQTTQSLTNIKNILEAAGTSMDKVVKTLVFIKNMDDFGKVNEVYGTFFKEGAFPARSCVEVARLPKDALVEIEVIAEV
ncbi:MAG: RidA family protein [Clostridia bacterium]|nr:RidA family protein [Clostridia bacterium]